MEKVFIFSRDPILTEEAVRWLKKYKVDVVDVLTDPSVNIKADELATHYNILVIDKQFVGNGRDTARLVRRIRKHFFDPIIGVELYAGDGEIFSLQVAGCNFTVTGGHVDEVCGQICETIGKISGELGQRHQQPG